MNFSFRSLVIVVSIGLALFLGYNAIGWWQPKRPSVFSQSDHYRPWIERLRKEKELPIGYVPWYFPFSYHRTTRSAQGLETGAPSGFSVEFSQALGKAMGESLGIKDLSVRLVPMLLPDIPDQPFPAIINREVAFECTASLDSPDIPKALDRSSPFFVSGLHIFSPLYALVRHAQSLRGRAVLVHEGALQHFIDRRLNEEMHLEVGINPYPIIQYVTVLLEQRQGLAMVGDALRIFNLAYALPQGKIEEYAASGYFGEVGYACTFLKGEEELKTVLNRAIAKTLADENYQRMYARWFVMPAPDINTHLNYPMPQGLQTLIEKNGGTINRTMAGLDAIIPTPPNAPMPKDSPSLSPKAKALPKKAKLP